MMEVTKPFHYLLPFFFFLLISLFKINQLQLLYAHNFPVVTNYIFPILGILLDFSLLPWLTNVCVYNNFGHMYI